MAIEHGDVESMCTLARYYDKEGDYSSMIVYHLMALKRGHAGSLSDLIKYYHKSGKIEEMVYYYIIQIEKYAQIENYYCVTQVFESLIKDCG